MHRLGYIIAVMLLTSMVACDRPGSSQDSDSAPTDRTEAKTSDEPPPPRGDDYQAIDAHTHLGAQAYPIVQRIMQREGIFRMVNLSGGHDPKEQRAHLNARGPLTDRIAPFFTVDWSNVSESTFGEQQADELSAAVRRGYAGLKIHKALGLSVKNDDGELLDVDTPRLDPLWERAGQLGVPVTIHTGDPKAFFKPPGPENERHEELKLAPDWSVHGPEYPSRSTLLSQRDRLLKRHSDTTFILAHFGNNPEDLEYVANLLDEHPNAVLDTSARIAEFGRHPADTVREFFIEYQDRILFGTDLGVHAKRQGNQLAYRLFLGSVRRKPPTLADVPTFFRRHWQYFESDASHVEHPIPIQGDWKVHPIDLPKKVLDKLYWKNAERIIFSPWLGRKAARQTIRQARSLVRTLTPSVDHE